MSNNSNSPKESLRAIKIFFYALIAGLVLFTAIVFILIRLQGPSVEDKSLSRIFFPASLFLAVACLGIANFLFKKRIRTAGFDLSLHRKLEIYREALILYMALCDGAAIFSVISFFMTGDYRLLLIIGAVLAAMLLRRPEKSKIFNELQLNSKEQMELT